MGGHDSSRCTVEEVTGPGFSWWPRTKCEDSYSGRIPQNEKPRSRPCSPSTLPGSLWVGHWEPGLANCSLRAQPGPPPVPMNIVFLDHGHASLIMCSPWPLSTHHSRADWLQHRLHDLQSLKYLLSNLLQRKPADASGSRNPCPEVAGRFLGKMESNLPHVHCWPLWVLRFVRERVLTMSKGYLCTLALLWASRSAWALGPRDSVLPDHLAPE